MLNEGSSFDISDIAPRCGIYAIIHAESGRAYIGQSVNILVRWGQHIRDLEALRHSNGPLLVDWQCYGAGAFEFRILELCERDDLLVREQAWIDEWDAQTYNTMAPPAPWESPRGGPDYQPESEPEPERGPEPEPEPEPEIQTEPELANGDDLQDSIGFFDFLSGRVPLAGSGSNGDGTVTIRNLLDLKRQAEQIWGVPAAIVGVGRGHPGSGKLAIVPAAILRLPQDEQQAFIRSLPRR